MLTQIINGQILTPQGWLKDGSVLISDGKILEVTNSDLAVIGAKVVDAKGMYIIPGFVAMNVHGGGGHDFKECTEEAFHSAIAAVRLLFFPLCRLLLKNRSARQSPFARS